MSENEGEGCLFSRMAMEQMVIPTFASHFLNYYTCECTIDPFKTLSLSCRCIQYDNTRVLIWLPRSWQSKGLIILSYVCLSDAYKMVTKN